MGDGERLDDQDVVLDAAEDAAGAHAMAPSPEQFPASAFPRPLESMMPSRFLPTQAVMRAASKRPILLGCSEALSA